MNSLDALKWKRPAIETALYDAGYEANSDKHRYVLRNMVTFQKRTDSLTECVGWAMARAENLHEQKNRRLDHGTGATYND